MSEGSIKRPSEVPIAPAPEPQSKAADLAANAWGKENGNVREIIDRSLAAMKEGLRPNNGARQQEMGAKGITAGLGGMETGERPGAKMYGKEDVKPQTKSAEGSGSSSGESKREGKTEGRPEDRKPVESADKATVLQELRNLHQEQESAQRAVQMQMDINRLAGDKSGRIELPPGAKMIIARNGVAQELTEQQANDPAMRQNLRSAAFLGLSFPASKNPGADYEALKHWYSIKAADLTNSFGAAWDLERAARQNPLNEIRVGTKEYSEGTRFLMDKNGNLKDVVGNNIALRDGDQLKSGNVVRFDTTVEEIKEGADKGKYRVTSSVQGESRPWFAYQNIEAASTKIGEKTTKVDRVFNASEWVPVTVGDRKQLMRPEDLKNYLDAQKEKP